MLCWLICASRPRLPQHSTAAALLSTPHHSTHSTLTIRTKYTARTLMASLGTAMEEKNAAAEVKEQGECGGLLALTALPRHPRPARCISCASMRLSLCAS